MRAGSKNDRLIVSSSLLLRDVDAGKWQRFDTVTNVGHFAGVCWPLSAGYGRIGAFDSCKAKVNEIDAIFRTLPEKKKRIV